MGGGRGKEARGWRAGEKGWEKGRGGSLMFECVRLTFSTTEILRFRNNPKFVFSGFKNLFAFDISWRFATSVILTLFSKKSKRQSGETKVAFRHLDKRPGP